jgi:hypothetical protein
LHVAQVAAEFKLACRGNELLAGVGKQAALFMRGK